MFLIGNAQQLREKQEQMENAKIGGSSTSNGSGNAASADLAGLRNSNEPGNPSKSRTNSTLVHIDPLQNDWRQFECNTWHLEPTVRLISWAGKLKSQKLPEKKSQTRMFHRDSKLVHKKTGTIDVF